jgi:hypothetical protein
MQRDNATHLPVPQCAFDPTVRAVAKFLATAEGQLIGCKASECTLDVKIAGAPFCSLVVQVLPVGRGGNGLTSGSVVSDRVRHTLRIGVCDLILKPLAEAFLQGGLQGIIALVPVRLGP